MIDKVTRRKQGAHYKPEEAILRLIGPLFLDELQSELARAQGLKSGKDEALGRLHNRLAGLTFFDPACGAGNFLIVAYRELRELEREIIKERFQRGGRTQAVADASKLSRLNVDQFFGIEIDEFPSKIAEVALWMTDHIAQHAAGRGFRRQHSANSTRGVPGDSARRRVGRGLERGASCGAVFVRARKPAVCWREAAK